MVIALGGVGNSTSLGRICTGMTLHKIPKFYIVWNYFVNYVVIWNDSPETLRKMCVSPKFPQLEIRLNYDILRSVIFFASFKSN